MSTKERICDCEETMHPGYEEQSGEPDGPRFDRIEANDDVISKTAGQRAIS
jgi:hypothetical protein